MIFFVYNFNNFLIVGAGEIAKYFYNVFFLVGYYKVRRICFKKICGLAQRFIDKPFFRRKIEIVVFFYRGFRAYVISRLGIV